MSTVLSAIRDGCRRVAESARWVKIDEVNLMAYPEVIGLEHPTTHDPAYHVHGDKEAVFAYFVILDTLNFGSGYFPYIDKTRGPSGYHAIAGRLKDYFARNGAPSPSMLRDLDAAWCVETFGQEGENPHASELMWLFSRALNQLGDFITTKCEGRYDQIFEGVETASEAISRLSEMSLFNDVHLYGSLRVPFFKRAQIMLQDLSIALPDSQVGSFPDLESLTIFADNVIPYVLRVDSILNIHPWLAERIEREDIIGSGSIEEIELRACAVHAVEILSELLKEEGIIASPRLLDYCLWSRGQRLKTVSSLHRHRCRSAFY